MSDHEVGSSNARVLGQIGLQWNYMNSHSHILQLLPLFLLVSYLQTLLCGSGITILSIPSELGLRFWDVFTYTGLAANVTLCPVPVSCHFLPVPRLHCCLLLFKAPEQDHRHSTPGTSQSSEVSVKDCLLDFLWQFFGRPHWLFSDALPSSSSKGT